MRRSLKLWGTPSHSDGFVGVEHDAEGSAHSSGREVLLELGADHAVVAVAGDDLAPHALVGVATGSVLGLVDVSDALSVVEDGGLAVFATLDLEGSLALNLGALATLEVREDSLLVEPTRSALGSLT